MKTIVNIIAILLLVITTKASAQSATYMRGRVLKDFELKGQVKKLIETGNHGNNPNDGYAENLEFTFNKNGQMIEIHEPLQSEIDFESEIDFTDQIDLSDSDIVWKYQYRTNSSPILKQITMTTNLDGTIHDTIKFVFDKGGMLTHRINTFNQGHGYEITTTTVNYIPINGNLLSVNSSGYRRILTTTFNQNLQEVTRITATHNDNGTDQTIHNFTYNTKGQLVEATEIVEVSTGVLAELEKKSWTYTQNGKISTHTRQWYSDGETKSETFLYTYNTDGRHTEIRLKKTNGEPNPLLTKIEYPKIDEQGNWTQKKTTTATGTEVLNRRIEYFN